MDENDAPSLYPAMSTLIDLSLSFRRQRFEIELAHLKELHKFMCTDLGAGGGQESTQSPRGLEVYVNIEEEKERILAASTYKSHKYSICLYPKCYNLMLKKR
jgi:hypothetical protein